MRRRTTIRAGIVVLAAAGLVAALAAPGGAATSPNLIKDGNAEQAAASTGGIVTVPHWTITKGAGFTAVLYGASGGFPTATDPGPANRGKNFFAGGPSDVNVVAVQTINLKSYLTAIQMGTEPFKASAYLGGYDGQSDDAEVKIDWEHGKTVVGTSIVLGPVTEKNRKGNTGLLVRNANGTVPTNANHAYVQLIMNDISGGYNDGYADNLSLTLG